jgi:hypothetical protein
MSLMLSRTVCEVERGKKMIELTKLNPTPTRVGFTMGRGKDPSNEEIRGV